MHLRLKAEWKSIIQPLAFYNCGLLVCYRLIDNNEFTFLITHPPTSHIPIKTFPDFFKASENLTTLLTL